MKILDRYIFRVVTGTTLIALLVILTLDIFFNLLNELEEIGKGDYGLPQVIEYLLLTSPRLIDQTLPMALLVGGLLGMGALASSSELTVMRASGVSLLRLVRSALQAGLVLSLIGFWLGEFIAPQSERLAQELRSRAQYASAPWQASGPGFWARSGQQFVNVGVVLPNQRIGAITIYTLTNESELTGIIKAQSARYQEDHWILQNVSRSRISTEAIVTDQLEQMDWSSSIDPGALTVLASDPQDLAIRELLSYISYLQDNQLDTRHYRLAFWHKIAGPFTSLTMLFIALPFVFGSQRSTGAGQRLLIGVLLGLTFFLLNRMLSSWVLLTGLPPVLGAILPTALFFAAGTLALRRMR
jgi:lipopolysaccharide export system permease protein